MHAGVPIQVAVRVRPLLGEEVHKNPDPCLFCLPNKPQLVVGNDKQFTFDYVLSQDATQTKVYETCVSSLVLSFFEGYNATVFAYGQTGSGKTYTMGTGNCVYLDEDERGIVPRAVTEIFDQIDILEGKSICKIRVSFIEVYREETTDLLENSTKNLLIREDEAGNIVVVGVREEPANSVEEVLNLLDAGTAIRHVGSTNMNDVSSRSHCIFTIFLDQYSVFEENNSQTTGNVLTSRFHFVDLAGSERAHRTHNQGDRFKESVSINTGLLALGNVISALSDPKRKNQHVPYRESKLTRLLKDSLGGNSRTVMITCLSSTLADLDENINSLKYATRAKFIRNKPMVNWDMETSKFSRMENEIQALRGQLQRRISDQHQISHVEKQRMDELEVENEKHGVEQHHYLQSLHEVNVLLQAIETSVTLPSHLVTEVLNWRHNWEKSQFERPVTAPATRSAIRRPQNDVVENLRSEVSKLKEQLYKMETCCQDIDELKQEVIHFGQENAQLRLELDVALHNENELKEKLFDQQLMLQNSRSALQHEPENIPTQTIPMSSQDYILQNFRIKSNILVSQLDDLDQVEKDERVSSDDDDEIKFDDGSNMEARQFTKQTSVPSIAHRRRFMSQIPRRTNTVDDFNHHRRHNMPLLDFTGLEENTLRKLQASRDTARDKMKSAEFNVREMTGRLRELEINILQKEGLIKELMESEHEARATSDTYKQKLGKLEKEFEKSKRELEDAQQKINIFEKGDGGDASHKHKLQNEYKRKLKTVQKKFDDLKQKETISNRIVSYQHANEKKVNDLEAWISRMRNQQAEMERKLKSEADKKSKFESELRRNEIRMKELEHKTDQQQKLLKRKNEEVVAAQRKLRNSAGRPDTSKVNDELEKKKQWIDNEIEKVVARQQDIEVLESELRERDESLRKKESLMSERNRLEVKKTKSSQNLSKSIMQLSVQMESIDQQISEMQGGEKIGKDVHRLEIVRDELAIQKSNLEETVNGGGLELNEQRRLIELGEAIEAVDEAIMFKNRLISEKQNHLDDRDDHYKNIEHLLRDMGALSIDEYKHLLGKLFLKIIELRKLSADADESRFHLELKISDQQKNVHDLQHMLQVMEAVHERKLTEQNRKYEQEVRFLMEQLRQMENETSVKENLISRYATAEKRITSLEKELYYYKVKSRQYKEYLRDFTNVSADTTVDDESPHDVHDERNHQVHSKRNAEQKNVQNGEEFHLPPVKTHMFNPLTEKRDRRQFVDQYNHQENKRLQEIFDSRIPKSPPNVRSTSRRQKESSSSAPKNQSEDELPASISTYPDSIEVMRPHQVAQKSMKESHVSHSKKNGNVL